MVDRETEREREEKRNAIIIERRKKQMPESDSMDAMDVFNININRISNKTIL